MDESEVPEDEIFKYHSETFEPSFMKFDEFREKEILTDVTIVLQNEQIKCHRVVLASFCPYFETMFSKPFKEFTETCIEMHKIDSKSLKEIIKFLYTRNIGIHRNNAFDLLDLSCYLQIGELISACCNFIVPRINMDNSLDIAYVAIAHNLLDLYTEAMFVLLNTFHEFAMTDAFKRMDKRELETLIASDEVFVHNEKEVYEAVERWIFHDLERYVHVTDLLRYVRLLLISLEDLREILYRPLIQNNTSCVQIVQEAIDYYDMNLSRADVVPRKSYSGVIFCMGGRGWFDNEIATVKIYSWLLNKWQTLEKTVCSRRDGGHLWYKGGIISVGGVSIDRYLRVSESFFPTGKPSSFTYGRIKKIGLRRKRLGVCEVNEVLYAIGGMLENEPLDVVEAYSMQIGKWDMKSPMTQCQGDVAVVELKGSIIAIGGNDKLKSLNQCEIYDPVNDVWRGMAPLNIARHGAAAVAVCGSVYVFGGYNGNKPLSSVEKYSLATGKWEFVSPMTHARGKAGVARIGRKIYVISGSNLKAHLDIMEIYDIFNDSWEDGPTMRHCKIGSGIVTAYIHPEKWEQLQDCCTTSKLYEEF